MNVKIIVAAHKKYQMPEDSLYIPLQVGAQGKENFGFERDDSGENISSKNPFYCELTGLYWAWKNLNAEYIGLVHYRRYFSAAKKIPKSEDEKFKVVLTTKQAESLLQNCDVILPKKRNYYISSIYNHYKNTMYIETLDEAGKIIEKKYPEYLKAFENLHHTTKMHAFNMFIMKKELLNEYCTWLFDILDEVVKNLPPEKYSDFHARYPGRISERLLDVWINTNHIKYNEIKVIDMQNVNWLKKGSAFLKAKFTGKRYEKSF